ncbi:type III sulfide quinone reductase, selenoprotein subtype [Sulfuriroseicoccus oceanibius]|uniref:NAD(P)/FAD-dependent oxidoreductase n=1 Tax=Sulfuriroseicoccus oceanibius TaxID=2707525 RepID=A0A6B3LA75_9BACT|nr:FAD/NAD(P)-binding oxidoreductase [Sulfuriroseicoccus oceanibius]QQL45641.1 NAD(P)/FAD-dependent oxidoreductase [Sulfuriroseicoccus oceanibius]
MKNLLILGAGTAGTIMANHLRKKMNRSEWKITIVDKEGDHYYQPGFLFMPFRIYSEADVVKPKRKFVGGGVDYLEADVDRIEADANQVHLKNGNTLAYDVLIVATGTTPVPEETEGMTGPDWRKRVHEFYTFEGAKALANTLDDWQGGRLVMHICEMPIKCPVAPLEFVFLADSWLRERGLRDKTELVYATPLSGAFTKPVASKILSGLLEEKQIEVVNDFNISHVDNEDHKIVSWDEREVPYDLLVTVPTNMGDPMIERSGLGDELNFVPTDKHTLQSKAHENIFVIGDATDAPTSKAGSVAHFEAEVLTENILAFTQGKPLPEKFDGHANCFIESGNEKAFLLDFNYELEPVPGKFPVPGIGPMSLLGESKLNHMGKMAFRWIYWNVLLPGHPIPMVGHRMTLSGKKLPEGVKAPQPLV